MPPSPLPLIPLIWEGRDTVRNSLSQFDMTLPGEIIRILGYGRFRSLASLILFLSFEFPLFPKTAVKKAIT